MKRHRNLSLTSLISLFSLCLGATCLQAGGLRYTEIAASGQAVPDFEAGSLFSSFYDAPLLGADRALYRASITTPSSGTRYGLWLRDHGTGTAIRGITSGETPSGASIGSFISTSNPTIVYGANASAASATYLSGDGVTSANNAVIVSLRTASNISGSVISAREGYNAGISDWKLESRRSGISVNGWNSVSFKDEFTGTGVNASNANNIWTTHKGQKGVIPYIAI